MPASYTVWAYSNTGFDRDNRPADTTALPVGYTEYKAVFEWQDRQLATIKIDSPWETAKNIDYIQLGQTNPQYYIVNGVSMVSPKTAVMEIEFDPILSAGGIRSIRPVGGWTTRANPSTDDMFSNTIPEPWSPSQPLVYIGKRYIQHTNNKARRFVVCTCDLSKADQIAAQIATYNPEASADPASTVVYPLTPAMTKSGGTMLQLLDIDDNGQKVVTGYYNLPYMYVFDLGTADAPNLDLVAKLENLRSIGIDSAIVNSFIIPGDALSAVTADETGFVSVLAGDARILDTDLPFKYGSYTPKNNKAYALYSYYTVLSIASGASMEYTAYDMAETGKDGPRIVEFTDPAQNGTCYVRPYNFRGNRTYATEQAVPGMPWMTAGILYQSGSGGLVDMVNANRKIRAEEEIDHALRQGQELGNVQRAFNSGVGLIQGHSTPMGVMSGILNAGTSAGALGVVSGAGNYLMGDLAVRHANNINNYTRERQISDDKFARSLIPIKAPELAFPPSLNISMYRGNEFCVAHVGLSDNDLKRLDKWLTMYGYAVDKPFEMTDLNCRKFFNFVKTEDAEVQAVGLAARDNQAIADVLNAGVRLWHVPPTSAAYDDNPIQEVK